MILAQVIAKAEDADWQALFDKAEMPLPDGGTLLFSHDDGPHLKSPDQVETDKSSLAKDKVVFLSRDPRDVLVSYYYEVTRRRKDISKAQHIFEGSLAEFLLHSVGSASSLLRYYQVWEKARHQVGAFHLVRYEDLHEKGPETISALLNFLGIAHPIEWVEQAIGSSSFGKMRDMETGGQLAGNRLRATDLSDPDSFKTRKGKVGGYAEQLAPDAIDYLNMLFQDLPDFYGYPFEKSWENCPVESY